MAKHRSAGAEISIERVPDKSAMAWVVPGVLPLDSLTRRAALQCRVYDRHFRDLYRWLSGAPSRGASG
jgi:hypothetical protein